MSQSITGSQVKVIWLARLVILVRLVRRVGLMAFIEKGKHKPVRRNNDLGPKLNLLGPRFQAGCNLQELRTVQHSSLRL